ncbi:hypothetical protein [Silvibacterium sp.]|uniref:hypothetical protein n=1 Tax=Silvibacterium sp. TaxID=1964179 RepID=UPI0039E548C1
MFRPLDYFCVLGVIALSLSGLSEGTKHLHGLGLGVFAAFLASVITAAMLWLRWRNLREPPFHGWWLLLPWLLFAVAFAVLFPLAHRHVMGGAGSDRDDALRVSAEALLYGKYIYSARTFLGNPVTPLPGAVLLAVPFYLLHTVGLENLFWLGVLLAFAASFFRSKATALIYVLLLLGTSTCTLDDFVVGGDFFINEVYVCVAMGVVIAAQERRSALWVQVAAEVFLGLAMDSRPVYIIALPLVVAYLWQKGLRTGAIRTAAVSGGTALAFSIPFYLYNPAEFAPLHVTHKLDMIPESYHAAIVLPVLGLLIACSGFFLSLTRPKIYLLMALSMVVMLGFPGIVSWFLAPFTLDGWYGLGLVSTAATPFLLWLFSLYESGTQLKTQASRQTEAISAWR